MPLSSPLVATTIILGGAIAGDPGAAPRLADGAALSLHYTPASMDRVLRLGALQDDLEGGVPLDYVPHAEDEAAPGIPPGAELAPPPPYGREGTRRWRIQAGYAYDVKNDGDRIVLGGVAVSQFIADGLSLDVEVNGLFVNQEREDGTGINVNLLFRWHFIQRPGYTIYMDAGAGVLYTNENVPHDGSEFNFTPQAGFGLTFDLGNEVRLMTGLKWHHISNADLYEENPGRDSILGYAGVSFPF